MGLFSWLFETETDEEREEREADEIRERNLNHHRNNYDDDDPSLFGSGE